RVVEPGEDVELPLRLVEDEAARAPTGDGDVARGARRERIRLELCDVEDSYCTRSESGDVQRRAGSVDRHAHRAREPGGFRAGARRRVARGGVELLVQMTRGDRAAGRVEHGDARLGQMSAHRERRTARGAGLLRLDTGGNGPRPLEPELVPGLGVAHVDL